MNRLYKRPMFRRGGSAEGGITSGLQSPRQGYAEPGTVIGTVVGGEGRITMLFIPFSKSEFIETISPAY